MHPPVIIVVSGPPAAGKSTLAGRLAERLGWPLLAKDAFKERLFAAHGAGGRAHSRRLSDLAWVALFHEAGNRLAAGESLVLEGNFRAGEHEAPLLELASTCGAVIVQVVVTAPARVLERRLEARVLAGTRHPGHLDRELLAEARAAAAGGPSALALAGELLHWDGSAAGEPEFETLAGRLGRTVGRN